MTLYRFGFEVNVPGLNMFLASAQEENEAAARREVERRIQSLYPEAKIEALVYSVKEPQ